MTRSAVPACLLVLLMAPATSRAQIDHLEVLEAPRLVNCADELPYFRVVVNAVDVDRKPVAVGLSSAEAKKSFHVSEGDREHVVQYVGLFESGGQAKSPGNYVLLLLDTSGSMRARLPSGQTRFNEAKAAVSRSLTNFTEDTDHIAVVPFNSHNVVSQIRGAAFQSTRQGVNDQLAAIPPAQANTALYTAVTEALPILKARRDAGYGVSLVVFSDGQNDVGKPGDDRGLLGPEGLAIVKELSMQLKVPITTVGFGVSGNAATVSALRELAWPTADSYYDVETNSQRLAEIFRLAQKRLTDRIQILFGPVRTARDSLSGQSIPFRVRLRTREGFVSGRSEPAWNAPAVGVPVFETKCTEAELRAILEAPPPDVAGPDRQLSRLLVLAMFSTLLAGLWFGAPRFVWPESYIPKPTFNRPASGVPQVDALRAPTFPPSRGGSPAAPPARGGPSPQSRPARPTDPQTIVIPPRSAPRPAAPSPSSTPQEPDPQGLRGAEDETVFRPLGNDPRKGR